MTRDVDTDQTDFASERLGSAWASAQGRLPEGWTLEGLRCASTGLAEGQRSEDWVAVATSAGGAERTYRSSDPIAALDGLVADLETRPER